MRAPRRQKVNRFLMNWRCCLDLTYLLRHLVIDKTLFIARITELSVFLIRSD